jgi:hypothetical protein
MARFLGLFRTLPQLLEKRRDSAEAQWIEPGNDVTRAILDGATPAMRQTVSTAAAPAAKAYVPEVAPMPAVPEAPRTRSEEPATQQPQPAPQTSKPAAEEHAERPAKRRRWHRAA